MLLEKDTVCIVLYLHCMFIGIACIISFVSHDLYVVYVCIVCVKNSACIVFRHYSIIVSVSGV